MNTAPLAPGTRVIYRRKGYDDWRGTVERRCDSGLYVLAFRSWDRKRKRWIVDRYHARPDQVVVIEDGAA